MLVISNVHVGAYLAPDADERATSGHNSKEDRPLSSRRPTTPRAQARYAVAPWQAKQARPLGRSMARGHDRIIPALCGARDDRGCAG